MTDHTSPLSARVTAHAQLPVPEHADVARWRAATPADIDAIWELEKATGRADHPNYVVEREEVGEAFNFSFVDVDSDTLVGLDADGRMVAHGLVVLQPGQQTLVKSTLGGGVLPEMRGRGIGRELLNWQVARARQQLATSDQLLPGWIGASCDERAPQNGRLYERAGLLCTRYFLSLDRMLADPIRDVEPADGIRVAGYTPELSAAVHAARDVAFMDHWSSQPIPDESWNAYVTGPSFVDDLSFVALGTDPDGSEHVVGFVMSSVNEEDWAAAGYRSSYIGLVGVLSGWRGRHIAQALLAAQLAASRAAGHERATLDVDSASPTGALGLYTGMGFFATNRELAYVLEF
ncbi:MAG: GNAT family N-acetyltransferase [Cryobacterium sp.]|uniref:GNAT family N-acetyltransferase n=1 Tax=unclassified Cryobacterium TaxID=2649013 RepID=UPI0018CB954A|nr:MULTISPECIES: GNAT family N-acetyltransferase [unclassified Cryobacterium]MCY7405657.1 GNAT family N-acetyltransferase [Cryobacterium sp.]MEC5153352.1 ribosomal protein S18 acetylase RimI-like enzyme [Cryobacterium sp. CAN_C3]